MSWNPFQPTSSTIARKSSRHSEKIKAAAKIHELELEEQLEKKSMQLDQIEQQQQQQQNRLGIHDSRIITDQRYQDLKQTKEETLREISNIQNKIKTAKTFTQKDPYTESSKGLKSLGISNENPLSDDYQGNKIPSTLSDDHLSGNPEFLSNQFTFGESKIPVGPHEREIIERTLERQHVTRQANAEQKQYFDDLTSGRIDPFEALTNPRTPNKLYVAGRQVHDTTSEQDKELLALYEKDPQERQIIEQERRNLQAATATGPAARTAVTPAAANPIKETVQTMNQINAGFAKIGENGKLSQKTPLPKYGDKVSAAEISVGQFTQGAHQTFESYYYLGKNVFNFMTGQPQEHQKRPPIQDQFLGSISKSIEDSQNYNIPFTATFDQNYQKFEKQQSKKSNEMIAGNLFTEGLLWAIPVSPAIRGTATLAKWGMGFMKNSDSFVRSVLEASSGTTKATDTAASKTNPWKKGTYQNTNMFREKLPSDIYGLDTATEFFTTPYRLGSGAGRTAGTSFKNRRGSKKVEEDPWYDPKENLPTDRRGRKISAEKLFEDDIQKQQYHAFIGESKSIGKQFQGTNINLGTGAGKTTGTGTTGTAKPTLPPKTTKPSKPKPDEPVTKTTNGLQLILDTKKIPKQTAKQTAKTKQVTTQKQLKKKQQQGSEYYLDYTFLRYPKQATSPQLSPAVRLDIRQELTPILKLGEQLKESTKLEQKFSFGFSKMQSVKQDQSYKQRQDNIYPFVNPFMFPAVRPAVSPAATRPATRPVIPLPWPPASYGPNSKRRRPDKDPEKDQGWFIPRVDPLGITTQFKVFDKSKSKGITEKRFQYWGSDTRQEGLGYFRPKKKGSKK